MKVRWKRQTGAIAVIVLVVLALIVPAASAGGCPTGASCRTYYTVHRGDTLTKIAYRYGTSVAALQQCNHIWNPDRIFAGQTLCICGGYQTCPRPKPVPPPPPKPVPCPSPCGPGPIPVPYPTGPWHAWYFNNGDMSGAPVWEQNYSMVNFNWGYGSPGPGVSADYFSARYQRTLYLAAGTYRVTTRSDDGLRVSIDNVLVIDNWKVQPVTTICRDVIITTGGNHQITVEYFEDAALAELYVSMAKLY